MVLHVHRLVARSSGAATWNQLQQRLRCRKLVHPCSEWTTHLQCLVSIHGHWGAGYLAWPPELSAGWWLVDGTQHVIPQSISTWGTLASSARPCAEQAVAQFKKLVFPYSAQTNASHSSCNCSLTWNELRHNDRVFLNEVFSEAQTQLKLKRSPLSPPRKSAHAATASHTVHAYQGLQGSHIIGKMCSDGWQIQVPHPLGCACLQNQSGWYIWPASPQAMIVTSVLGERTMTAPCPASAACWACNNILASASSWEHSSSCKRNCWAELPSPAPVRNSQHCSPKVTNREWQ